ncbi:tRNA (guanine(37)-N1)-methyltransferase-like [Daphnia carinata]|uniref:tRNA (guanine(37)-N1)-methyltransferase-like n=1 Tax=Daphnia carinata TaxID=120202 RepID=UPI00257A9F63|nr:tRNA (guanine(37)-N1)-methyltransferase-like [Daphnia carinata]
MGVDCGFLFSRLAKPTSIGFPFLRSVWTKMDLSLPHVRGMTELDRAKFTKQVTVPSVEILSKNVGKSMPVFKKYLLKMEKLKPVTEVQGNDEKRKLLLDPILFETLDKLREDDQQKLSELDVSKTSFSNTCLQLEYHNYRIDDVFKAVLPEGKEGCTSYSRIGHIIHLNLRDHLLPYKNLIGQVLVDKLIGVKTVVNKSSSIDSTYRNFQMEVLAGEADFVTEVKENMCTFKFDFSQVYWNSRLCTEHERIIKLLPQKSVLFDVFAGVGPFSVPAAKIRKCRVFANDLNPSSYHWLKENVRLNKVENIETFNLDGRQFIREQMPPFLLARPSEPIHVTMNLPALAVEFLDAFIGLLSGVELDPRLDITVHVYSFCEESSAFSEMRTKVESALKHSIEDGQIVELVDVRDVSPKKHMLRLSFRIPPNVLTKATEEETSSEPKRLKLDLETQGR